MNNNKTHDLIIKRISLLYELSLAIGKSLNLKENCDIFLKTLMARKNLAFTSIWLKNEYISDKEDKEYATLVYANPKWWIKETTIPLHHPLFTLLGEKDFIVIDSSDNKLYEIMTEKRVEEGRWALFRLNKLGILKLFSLAEKSCFAEKELSLLKDVIFKFAISLEGCLLHQRLIEEVSERKRIEEELIRHRSHLEDIIEERTKTLQESEEKFKLAFENAKDAIFWADAETGVLINCNKAAELLLEKERAEIIGSYQTTVHPPEKAEYFADMFERHVKHKEWMDDEAEVITKSGKIIPVNITASVVVIREKPIIQGIFHDITERKKMEAEIRKAEKLEVISQIAAETAHEIKNPLQVINSGLYYLKMPLQQQKIKVQDILQRMNNATLRINDFINDLLNITAPIQLKRELVNITKLIESAINEFPKELFSDIDFQQQMATNLPEIEADFNRLKQVIVNLVKNAVESMKEVRNKKLKLASEIKEDFITITVSDTGHGIPHENIGKIFDPFYTTRAKGIGLGMSICFRFIEAHQGTIEVESQVGYGTTFVISLPLKRIKIGAGEGI